VTFDAKLDVVIHISTVFAADVSELCARSLNSPEPYIVSHDERRHFTALLAHTCANLMFSKPVVNTLVTRVIAGPTITRGTSLSADVMPSAKPASLKNFLFASTQTVHYGSNTQILFTWISLAVLHPLLVPDTRITSVLKAIFHKSLRILG
jgi:hypothetical protein